MPKRACTRCRCIRKIIFDKKFNFNITSGLVPDNTETFHIRLCQSCLVNASASFFDNATYNQVMMAAGKGNSACRPSQS